jgi:hypothetical protein
MYTLEDSIFTIQQKISKIHNGFYEWKRKQQTRKCAMYMIEMSCDKHCVCSWTKRKKNLNVKKPLSLVI